MGFQQEVFAECRYITKLVEEASPSASTSGVVLDVPGEIGLPELCFSVVLTEAIEKL